MARAQLRHAEIQGGVRDRKVFIGLKRLVCGGCLAG